LFAIPAGAQSFGQNHVIIRDFPWKVRSTEHFDIFYYDDSKPLVGQAAEILERGFAHVSQMLNIDTEPPVWATPSAKKKTAWQRRPFFLYASPNDFEQSNIADVGDGTGGITEPLKNRFMVYNNGEAQWLDEVITHEFTHIMQYYVLISGFWKTGGILKTIAYPLWFIEGMPDYVTEAVEGAIEESLVRDAATSGTLIPLTRLEHFGHLKPHQITLGYHEGAVAMQFLAEQYGRRKVGDMLRLFETRLETSRVLLDLIGIDIFAFDSKFLEYEKTRYRRIVRVNRLKEPTAFGDPLTYTNDTIPQFNTSPVLSPDFKTMFFLSTRRDEDPPQVWTMDMTTGRSRQLPHIPYGPIENIQMGNFANLSRMLTISPDGRWLGWGGTKNHRDSIFIYDVRSQRLEKIPLPGFETVQEPAFSPDGRLIAFSGMKDSFTDIYLYDRKTRQVRQLTDDTNDDQMPCFTPDGSAIVFSEEIPDPLDPHHFERRLYRLRLNGGTLSRLESSGAQARDPVVSADGKRMLFVIDDGEFSDIYELNLETHKVVRLTRTIGGSFTPFYADHDQIVFSSLRRGSVHIYKAPRSQLMAEVVPPVARELPPSQKFMLPGMGNVGVSTSTVALSPERPYHFTYSSDLFIPAAFYSSVGGFFGTSYWQGSDLLGNHTQSALIDVHSAQDFDYQAQYAYSRFRPQMIAQFSGIAQTNLTDPNTGDTYNDNFQQETLGVLYPFDRYHRAEAYLQSAQETIQDLTASQNYDNQARSGTVALVRDTTTGRYLVIENGNRLRLSMSQTAEVLGGNRRYSLASAEAQQFFRVGSMNALAFRLYGAQTYGPDSPQLIVAGEGGVRGYDRGDPANAGGRMMVGTAEWRFPIFPDLNYYMWYFFPDFYFKAVFGTLFSDTGMVWNSEGDFSQEKWTNVRNSVGVGLRIYTFILQEYPLIVAMDWAQRTTDNGHIFYVYLGESF
jgi:Tol biopolymer transport system component